MGLEPTPADYKVGRGRALCDRSENPVTIEPLSSAVRFVMRCRCGAPYKRTSPARMSGKVS